MENKTWAWILKVPMMLILVSGILVGLYASVKSIAGLTHPIAVTLTFVVIFALYIWGEMLANKQPSW